ASRTGQKSSRATDQEAFESLLDEQVGRSEPGDRRKGPDAAGDPLPEEAPGDLSQGLPGLPTTTGEVTGRELEARTREKGEEEAEKWGAGGGTWRGPQVIVGLTALGGVQANLTGQLSGSDRPRSERRSETLEEVPISEARVDPEVLNGLIEAGLGKPLIGLADPRLAGAVPALSSEDGWREVPVRGGVGFVWERTRRAYQRLEWAEGSTILESAAGERVHWLERRGNQVFQRQSGREIPRDFPR
ncbi:MAG: hypothetical protein AB1758_29760, partial [Candidatus Eremiobacterota bacterium]